MKTGFARTVAPIVVLATLAGVAPCLGQDLNIEIPVPEPGSHAPAARDAGKRKPTHRGGDAAENRRAARPSPIELRPSWGASLGEEPPTELGPLPGDEEPSPSRSKSARGWPELQPGAASRQEPSWGNPAGTAPRRRPPAEAEAADSDREKPSAAKAPARGAKNRPESKDPAARGAWLHRWFPLERREGPPADPPQVARRHRKSAPDSSKDLAPPFSAKPRLPTPLDLDSLISPQRD